MEKKLYPILLSLLAVILLVSPFTWAMSPPTNLLVDGMVKPTNFIFDPEIQDNLNDGGLENPNPTFSWVPTGNQTAYRIIVGDSSFNVEIGIGNMWDSTKIESINTSAIYEGDPLESNKVYYWSVITWDENDTPSFPEDSSEKLYYENFQMNHFIKALEFDGHSNDMAAFAAGDINNNSLTDFIVASYGPGRIYAYINQGDGTFHQQLIADETQTYPEALLLIDTNNNGNLDLVVTNVKSPHEQIDIYLNDGFGNFTYSGKLSDYTSVASKALSAADLNRDGYMDLVEGMSGGTYGIQVYINKKDGSFEQPVAYANGKKVNDLTLIDFNNDSYPDILIGCNGSNQLYLNKGDGTFELSWTSDEEDNTYAITPVDFNSDGLWDFIEGNYVKSGESEVGCTDRYYKNNGDGTFDLVYSTDKLDATLAISAGDINLDGKLDYVTGNGKSSEKNRVYLNDIFYNDNSNSSPFNPYMASTFFTEVYRTLLFDLTGDGRMDLLRGIEGANDILLINNSVEPNTPPSPPRDNFSSHYSKTTAKLKLSWGDGSDAHTPANQLAYNIRISTNPDARTSPESVKWNVVSGAIGTSDHAGSFWGNIGRSTYVYLSIPPQTYFWQVQSIDTSKKQGEWSDVQIYNTPPEGNISSLVQGDLASHFQTEPELKYLESSRFLTNISFSIRDLEANDCFLTEFEYSTSSTADWMGIDDDSASLMGDWPDRGGDYFQASDEWGENYSFVWQTSESLREGLKSDSVRIRFKVSDIHGASSIVTSGEFSIDNKNPRPPGTLTATEDFTSTTITLGFGAPAEDANFVEYILFWKANVAPSHTPENYDGYIDQKTFSPLGERDFDGNSTIEISGLLSDTTYYFSLFSYDSFGNFSFSPARLKKTNHTPIISIVSADQRRDGSGLVDIVFEAYDNDKDTANYLLDECYYRIGPEGTNISMTPVQDDPFHDTTLSLKPEASQFTFVWNAGIDIPDSDHSDIYVALSISDNSIDISSSPLFGAIRTDTSKPITGALNATNPSANSIDWMWTEVNYSMEQNFSHYELWYSSIGVDCVLNKDIENASYLTISERTTISTTTFNLSEMSNYWGVIWVYDTFGYENHSSTDSDRTGYPPEASFTHTPIHAEDGSGYFEVLTEVTDKDGDLLRMRIEYSLNGQNWEKASIDSVVISSYGAVTVSSNPEDYYQLNGILTRYDGEVVTNSIYFNWKSMEDVGRLYSENVLLRIKTNDGGGIRPGIDSQFVLSEEFLLNNSRPLLLKNTADLSYSHKNSLMKLAFIGEHHDDTEPVIDFESIDLKRFVIYDDIDYEHGMIWLTGAKLSSSTPNRFDIKLTREQRNMIARWDADNKEPYLKLLSSAAADNFGNYTLYEPDSAGFFEDGLSIAGFKTHLYWNWDRTSPEIKGATYTISGGDIRLEIYFSEDMNIWDDQGMNKTAFQLEGFSIHNSSDSDSQYREINHENYRVIKNAYDTDTLVLAISPEEHSHIWSWPDPSNIFISVNGSAISDLSGNPIDPLDRFPIDVVVSTDAPKIVYYKPENFSTNIPRVQPVCFAFDQNLKITQALESIRMRQLSDADGKALNLPITGRIQVNNFTAPLETEWGIALSSLTFIPDYQLPGNALIEVELLADKILTLANIAMEENFIISYRTQMDTSENNLVFSSSNRTSLRIPGGIFNVDGMIDIVENIPSNQPIYSPVRAFHSANSLEKNWDDPFHYPFEELTSEITFVSTSGIAISKIFENFGEIFFDYSGIVSDDGYLANPGRPPVKENTLKIYWLNELAESWVPLVSSVNTEKKIVSAPLRSLSIYTVMGGKTYSTDQAHPYPVPYKPSEIPAELVGTPRSGITFTNLPSDCKIEIYTIGGRLVAELSHSDSNLSVGAQPGQTFWSPVENKQGKSVASGTYLYLIKSESGVKSGKLMIIR